MTQLLRILNAFCAALFLVMALVSLAVLGAGRGRFVGGPGGPWASAGWAALFALLGLLAFLNLRRAAAERERLIALNVGAALLLVAGAVALEGAARLLCGSAALPFALTALVGARRP
ncbi:MAG TPA: hypothetical protein VK614_04195 [Allosphingosinicella sp.]|nr:hypothetical protein [Allosphingosinicella sp.]